MSRDRKILLAAVSSVASKGGGALLQLMAMPLIFRVLGAEKYGILSLVSSILAILSFGQIGLGSYLTRETAHRIAVGDHEGVRARIWTALGITFALVGFLAISLYCMKFFFGLGWLWGGAYGSNPELLGWGFNLVIICGLASLVLSVMAGAQAGYQELHYGNIYGGASNFISAILLFWLVFIGLGDVRLYWVILYAVPLFFVLLNSWHFIRRHPDLAFKREAFSPAMLGEIIRLGLAYTVVQTLLPMAQRELGKLILAQHDKLSEVAMMSVFLQVTTLAGGLISIVTGPLFGALVDAKSCGHVDWVAKKYKTLIFAAVVLSSFVVAVFSTFGGDLLSLWVGGEVVFGRSVCVVYSVYFSLTILIHVNQIFGMALGRLKVLAILGGFELTFLVIGFASSSVVSVKMVLIILISAQLITLIFLLPYVKRLVGGTFKNE